MSELAELLDAINSCREPSRSLDDRISRIDPAYAGMRVHPYIAGTMIDDGANGAIVATPSYSADLQAALDFLDRKLCGCWFKLGRGRTRPDEPLYGAIVLAGALDVTDPDGWLSEAEHEVNLPLAVVAAVVAAFLGGRA